MDKSVLKDVDEFCKELRPIEDICYLERRYNDQLIPLAKKYNILGMHIPKELNGRGADEYTYVKALVRIGMEGSGVRSFFSAHSSLAQKVILKYGNDYHYENYLKPSARGDVILAFALTEPDAGSNPLEMRSTAKADGDYYILNGTKYLITNATIADAIVVFAKTSEDRISAFVIDAKSEYMEREELVAKMGTPTTDTGMFEMHNYKVPRENLLGKEGDGWAIAKEALMNGRLSVAAGCVGSIKDCLLESIRYSKQRIQYGKPIAKHQLVQEHIAAIKVALSASKVMLMRATILKSRWENSGPDNKNLKRIADIAIAEAKLFCSNAAYEASDRAVQIFGGRGWSYLYRVGRHFVDNRVCRIYEGSDEIIKLKIAAGVLGKEFRAYN
jgi:alkylation response protein AidB-like acyl-CoA dehydrogenase